MRKFSDFGIEPKGPGFVGKKIDIDDLLNIEIIIHKFEIKDSTKKAGTKYLTLQIEIDDKKKVVFTGSNTLMEMIQQVPESGFPFKTKIIKQDKRLEFS